MTFKCDVGCDCDEARFWVRTVDGSDIDVALCCSEHVADLMNNTTVDMVRTVKLMDTEYDPRCGICGNAVNDGYRNYHACRIHIECLEKYKQDHEGVRLWIKRWGGAKNKDDTQTYSYVLATPHAMFVYMRKSCRNPSAYELCRTIDDDGKLLDGDFGFGIGGINGTEPEPDKNEHISYRLTANLPTHMFEVEMPI